MSEWTDDRIIDALQTQSTWFGNDAIIKCADAYDVVTQVRDDLQARIAELEAQLAAARRWEPVEMDNVCIALGYGETQPLPDGYAVCRVAGEGTNGN